MTSAKLWLKSVALTAGVSVELQNQDVMSNAKLYGNKCSMQDKTNEQGNRQEAIVGELQRLSI